MPLIILRMLFILVGLGFKLAVVPFHLWAPDAYQGAPTPVTAFIATGSKLASFTVGAKILVVGFAGVAGSASWPWQDILAFCYASFRVGWAPIVAVVPLMLFVMMCGALGSMVYYASSFVGYVGNRTFRSTWFWFYISRPFVGGALAVIFFFIVGSGMVSGTTVSDLMKVGMISHLRTRIMITGKIGTI